MTPRAGLAARAPRAGLLTALALLLLLLAAALPGVAQAHPLGNFSTNHVAVVSVSRDRVDVRYLLDEAEVPTFQERGRSGAAVLARKRAEVARGLRLMVDGRHVALVFDGPGTLTHRAGQGGLATTRVVLRLHARVAQARRVTLHDGTFPGRVGWKAIVAAPGRGTAVRSSVPSGDPTRGLTRYPAALLSSPADVRDARFAVAPGDGTLVAPRDGRRPASSPAAAGTGFTRLFEDAAAGHGVLVFLLFAAFGWGALHALSPGHGKTMVAAYLIGTRGRPRDAVALGLTVTAAHTIGVFALGIVTLALSAYVLPEDLYPWLNLVSGVLVLGVGIAVLRARARVARGLHQEHHDDHRQAQGQRQAQGRRQAQRRRRRHVQWHGHTHPHPHPHPHPHECDGGPSRRATLALGASAGMIPCPSALVVLLAAIAQHEIALGLLLIVAFSAGLAATLTTLGVLVVKATRLPKPGRLATVLPAVSALAIVVLGAVLTARAVPPLLG